MIQEPLGNRTARGLARRIWSLHGTLGFMVVGVRYLWHRLLGLLGRWAPTVRGLSTRADVPILFFPPDASVKNPRPNDANAESFRSFLVAEKIDLVVSVSASQIFKRPVLETPPLGCINLHNAPLPHYRGMLPNFWQLYDGASTSVLTIHQMVEDLDAGAILHQEPTEITPRMSLEALIRLTKRRSAAALWGLLCRIVEEGVETRPLPDEKGSYHSWPTRDEARELRRRGRRLL